jgi:hypothetical protein
VTVPWSRARYHVGSGARVPVGLPIFTTRHADFTARVPAVEAARRPAL